MKLSPKQKIAQDILAQHSSIKVSKTTLLYTLKSTSEATQKPCIVVSVSKKVTPNAVDRNYNKRVLRAILRENASKDAMKLFNWMWICKDALVTKDIRLALSEKIKQIKA